ncbi:DedA family protein [Paracoccus spongiarum]|uniref:DedA family protein n=1 Tax=Paracoccus spongiarum TaxID=3064387 RepID=A0ABT9J9V9_9RHOB|nr:DedA family protein [Paracoccus sp. 2205BS29-5]MDP5306597.1 DedA family protein [Paracoccus sp. 2205BS29-5]
MLDWIASFLEGGGAWAIAALMLLENIFPPIPSELIMPMAGFNAARGTIPLWLAIAAGAAGSLAGAYLWYLVGLLYGPQRLRRIVARHGRWVTMTPEQLDRAQGWFDRHGRSVVFFGRFIPTVRTLISVPAGLAGMFLPRFLVFSGLGSLIWCGALAGAGYWLEDSYDRVGAWLNPLSTAVILALVAAYLWRVIRWRR